MTMAPPRWEHQTEALDFIRDKKGAMLAMEMGCGKSRCAVERIDELQAHRAIILCPLSIVDHVWPEQIRTYSTRKPRIITLGNRFQSVRDKLTRAQNLLAEPSVPAIVIINFESAWRDPFASWAINQKWDILIVDESHKLKAPAGKASLWVSRLSSLIPHRLALTGTPMPNSPLDIFAQYRIVDRSVYGTNYQAFETRYAVKTEILVRKPVPPGTENSDGSQTEPEYTTVAKVTDYKDLEHLEKLFYTKAYRVTADEALDLPPVLNTYQKVTLGPKAQRTYLQMENEFTAELQNGERLTAPNALAKLLRLQQITSGFAPSKSGDTIKVDNAKTDALTDLLQGIPPQEPVVVFARFHHDLDEINQATRTVDRNSFELSGRTKQIEEWKQQGGVLAVQIQAGGLGISLTEARYCIYYSLGFNLGDYLQSLARTHRPGQTRPVQYIHLLAADTIDLTVMHSLAHKLDVVSSILERRSIPKPDTEGFPPPQTQKPAQPAPPRYWITNQPTTSTGASST